MPDQAVPINAAAIAPWIAIGITFLFNVVNLGISLANMRRTKTGRSDGIRFEQFKSLKGPVDGALAELRSSAQSLLAIQLVDINERKQLIEEFNEKVPVVYSSLTSCLLALDQSNFASGQDWISSTSELWDDFITTLERTHALNKSTQKHDEVIAKAASELQMLIGFVVQRLDVEVGKHIK